MLVVWVGGYRPGESRVYGRVVDVGADAGPGRPLGEALVLRVSAGPPERRRLKVGAADGGGAGWRVDVDGRQVVVGRDGSQQVVRVPEAVTAGSRTVVEKCVTLRPDRVDVRRTPAADRTGADLRLRLDPVGAPAPR